eukprot:7678279-Pyramimonas_sp.AAC.1
MLSLAHGAYGRFQSRQSFARCAPAAPFAHQLADIRGLEVDVCRVPVVDRASELRHPLDDQGVGGIDWITEGRLA